MTGLLHAVAAFLLTLVGYSGGAVLVASRRRPRPAAWELPVSSVAGVAAVSLAPDLVGAWVALPAAVVAGGAVGGAAGRGPPATPVRQRKPGPRARERSAPTGGAPSTRDGTTDRASGAFCCVWGTTRARS